MIKALIGAISAIDSRMIEEKTALRFKDKTKFVTPEALIIHEQNFISDDRLLEACMQEHDRILQTPDYHYIPPEVLHEFSAYECVVIDVSVADGEVILGLLPEFENQVILSDNYRIKKVYVPIYYYVDLYTKQYGNPSFLADLPVVDKLDFIIQEALRLGAFDITITNVHSGAQVYYNVRKMKKHSSRQIEPEDVGEIGKLLASKANATMADESAKPRYFGVDLDRKNRGRVVINKTYYGRLITIRVLPNTVLRKTIEELGIEPSTCEFIRETMLSDEKGLRLFIGETASGKNTTILAALHELVKRDRHKIVSLEQPVEILVDGIEQINAETDLEFEQNADSLLRQNPDIVYFTEITARTGKAIMQQSNTSKAVFSTIHANSISEVLFRLQDITSMPVDRIILTLHSCVYQELVRDDRTDTVKPYNRCVYFSDDLKMSLYGKSFGEIVGVLKGEEMRWR